MPLKRSFFILLLFLVSLVWSQEQQLSIPYTKFVLPNGLTVLVNEDYTTPSVIVDVWYHVGSSYEKTGRTGFAHLFEHIMFEGSGHVKEGDFDNFLEAAGGNNNGSTNVDRTNYFEVVPSNAVDLALYLESDRMGYLLDSLTISKLDGQRSVVKNERRQRVDNQPYGLADETILEMLYPVDYPYHWPVIGYMKDLNAASLDDVKDFFKQYYAPNNAVLVIVGDVDPQDVKKRVTHWFSDVPGNEEVVSPRAENFIVDGPKYKTLEDKVQLPRLYMAWVTPAYFHPGDAEMDVVANILGSGKNSRLYKRLVYDMEIAQSVSVYQASSRLNSEFRIVATARPGHTLDELKIVIDEELEKLINELPPVRDLERVVNQYEANFLNRLQSLYGKAESLHSYFYYTGNPDYSNENLMRYKSLSPNDISNAVDRWLSDNRRVVVSIVPNGKNELAVTGKGGSE